MNNETRRAALSVSREKAMYYAQMAEDEFRQEEPTMRVVNTSSHLANMWANVAQAMKTGDAAADA